MAQGLSPDEVDRADPVWLHALLVAALPVTLFLVMGNQLDGDTYHYVEYWQKLRAGILHVSSLNEAAPKPIPILLFGATNELFGNPGPLVGLSIIMGAMAAALAARSVHLLFGRLAARLALLAVALDPLFVRGMLEGSSAVLELFFLCGALAIHLYGYRYSHIVTGLLLMGAGLCRPEVWPLFAVLAAGTLVLRPAAARRRVGLTAAIALTAPILWLAFDRFLTGDALFSFRDTLSYGSRHKGPIVAAGLFPSALVYLRSAASTMVEALPGPSLLLGGAGMLLIARRRPLLASTLACTVLAIVGFYYLPFRSGLPLLSRFLLVPIVLFQAFAGATLARIIVACSEERAADATGWRAPRSVIALVLAAVASLHSIDGLRRYATGLGAFHAGKIRELTRTLEWLEDQDPNLRTRKLVTAARRKGLPVVKLGLSSDQVTSFESVDGLLGRASLREYDYLLLDPEDIEEFYRPAWEALVSAPTGFEELRASVKDSTPRVFRANGIVHGSLEPAK